MFMMLSMGEASAKNLLASLIGDGSVTVIAFILVLAILAAVVIYLQKKKKSSKGENEDE